MVTPPSVKGSGGARFAPNREAILRGASALPPAGLAAFTNALEAVCGGGPMVNEGALDAPPPVAVLNASTAALPTTAISVAGIMTVRWAESTNEVGRLCPFQRITVRDPKLEPVAESVKSPPPALVDVGVIVSRSE